MTFLRGKKQRVRFVRRAVAGHDRPNNQQIEQPELCSQGRSDTLDEIFESLFPFVLPGKTASMIPDLFTTLPPIRDLLHTGSSQVQDETIQECLPFLSGLKLDIECNEHGIPHLDRKKHITFLHHSLRNLPAPFVAADASRPWFFYWALSGLVAMGEDVSQYRERLISTLAPIQNSGGGFGGGNGQMSHLAPTYAVILSLIIVGGAEALDIIDRKAMWKWLGALKQPDGGFQMCVGGEEDIRGAYIAAVIITLLNLPLQLSKESLFWSREATLLTNLPEWISRCQTYEGGVSSRPDAEAHGAYAFCALACLSILDDPHIIIPEYLDVPCLISWLSARQYAPEGGFSGRTNKLVDGCYSHWVGGCWPLIEACLDGPSISSGDHLSAPLTSVGHLYSREGLIRYILCCCQEQSKRGGLRDKPSHNSDSYHTCYVLAGLSSAQHKWHFNTSATKTESSGMLTAAYQWTSDPILEYSQIFDEEDRVNTWHPIFAIPEGASERARSHFESKGGF
ncbi:CaaX farnesyltransferase-like protein beta subunit Ram1 [Mollisia scopiformis]|uniref:Protein farnesyltransferase subunit beta n=1 Tax=Mollisia scopiformis TaxID=149040 RepID=A0A194XNG1_MOLSC|nr:CaaX farnesyltransferase-like protein beta subunit Ram1 [Mollisia scopiformis]KUJ21780.1 CaaX farnesyltransferas-like protein beta subunit Ram1 [Mollisia scopiformis]